MSKEQKIRVATQWMIEIADNNQHGYSQSVRWGPSYDCSSLVIQAWEMAGVPVKSQGATYTGNMYEIFIRNGFTDVSSSVNFSSGSGLQYGDICLNHSSHVVAYIGNNRIVHARSSEGTSDTIDNSGNEIRTQSYWNFPWDCILRYTKEDSNDNTSVAQNEEEEASEVTISISAASATILDIQANDIVKIIGSTYYNGAKIPQWVKNRNWIVMSINGDRAVINESEDHKTFIMSPINIKDIKKVDNSTESINIDNNQSTSIKPTEYSTLYTVKNGDNLWNIAARELGDGLRYREIKTLNNLTSGIIYPGQVLKLP